jgi:hypothetical protein
LTAAFESRGSCTEVSGMTARPNFSVLLLFSQFFIDIWGIPTVT